MQENELKKYQKSIAVRERPRDIQAIQSLKNTMRKGYIKMKNENNINVNEYDTDNEEEES